MTKKVEEKQTRLNEDNQERKGGKYLLKDSQRLQRKRKNERNWYKQGDKEINKVDSVGKKKTLKGDDLRRNTNSSTLSFCAKTVQFLKQADAETLCGVRNITPNPEHLRSPTQDAFHELL